MAYLRPIVIEDFAGVTFATQPGPAPHAQGGSASPRRRLNLVPWLLVIASFAMTGAVLFS